MITGTALSQAVNVTANNIPSGVTAYNQAGQRITGNGSGVFKYKSGSCFLNGSSKSISCDFHIWMVALYGGSWLSDCVLFTGTSNSGSTTFYKCPDSILSTRRTTRGPFRSAAATTPPSGITRGRVQHLLLRRRRVTKGG